MSPLNGPHEPLRVEYPVAPGSRVATTLFGVALGVGPWVVSLLNGGGPGSLGEVLILLPTTLIGGLLVAAALVGRASTATVEQGALVVRRERTPLLPPREVRYPAATIESI